MHVSDLSVFTGLNEGKKENTENNFAGAHLSAAAVTFLCQNITFINAIFVFKVMTTICKYVDPP